MEEKLAKKLNKVLSKAGIDENKIADILDEVEKTLAEEEVKEDDNPVEDAEPVVEEKEEITDADKDGEEKVEEEIKEEEKPAEPVEDAPVEEGVAPVDAEQDGSIESAINSIVGQQEEGVAPVEEVAEQPVPEVPNAPVVDIDQVNKLGNDLQEANKTIEGLIARIDSLESALKQSGIMTDGGVAIGDEQPKLTPNANAFGGNPIDDVLDRINGRRY